MTRIPIIFAGSFQHYSTYIADALFQHPQIDVRAIITTPPMPTGRNKVITKTHTHRWAETNTTLQVFTPDDLFQTTPTTLLSPLKTKLNQVYFVTAGYGKLLPPSWLTSFKQSLNLHFSLLPKFRGANPAEWSILLNEDTVGITLIEMAEEFDTGAMIASSSIPRNPNATRVDLYEELYNLGADTLPTMLLSVANWHENHPEGIAPAMPQPDTSPTPEARRFSRAQGFIDWQIIKSAMDGDGFNTHLLTSHLRTAARSLELESTPTNNQADFINRAVKALYDFPGVWTYIPTKNGKQRLKIHQSHINEGRLILDTVQVEGKQSSSFNQIKSLLHETPE